MLVRRRCSSYSVSTPSRPGSRSYCATTPALALRALGDLPERDEQLLDLGGRLGDLALFGGEDAPVERDGAEEQVEQRRRELEAPEAEVVEHVLELVREPRHARRPEERPRGP